MVEHWILNTVSWFKNGFRDLNALVRNVLFLFANIMSPFTICWLLYQRLIHICLLLFTFFYHHISHLHMLQLHCTVCLPQHTIPKHTDKVCTMTALQNGWKVQLMFHLCLTFSFFRVASELYINRRLNTMLSSILRGGVTHGTFVSFLIYKYNSLGM